MSDLAIKCEHLSKRYRIGEQERYKALRDVIADGLYAPIKWARRTLDGRRTTDDGNGFGPRSSVSGRPSYDGHIWALDDVSFEVKRGEVVGIIGRNGAGKSTLLKILSRITKPTKGHAEIHGRVGSLLEVGTGFHPELTGRENIYLNGAILGMHKAEINRKFDEIVAFAEVEKFIDTPVKRYSSGMHVRLAFAVAAHMETEILLVDEVLAVGDAQFQKKCFEKMREVGRDGRTILFVSHNMAAIRSICELGLVLDGGKRIAAGAIDSVVDNYLASIVRNDVTGLRIETASFVVDDVNVSSCKGPTIKTFDPVEIRIKFTPKVDVNDPGLYVGLLTLDGRRVAGLDFRDFESLGPIVAGQQAEMGFSLSELPILPGSYQLEIHLKDMAEHKIEFVAQTFAFEVVDTPIYGGRKLDSWFGHIGLNAKAIYRSLN
jgi:lipopolysaccharide transport system ATP-binding protein